MQFIKPEFLSIKNHPDLSEAWVQELIANDPSIIGLGDLRLRGKERIQPRAGRLDLLLQDSETNRRYEVEVQLGSTDESHIIRTIEYWDIEKKRYPLYDHCAVIIAENITSRFLNVISLFNGTIPLIAIQMKAIKVGEFTSLIFTTVLDEMPRGLIEEDEDAELAPTDRAYWEQKGTKETVSWADKLLSTAQEFEGGLELKYNKHYIGLSRLGQAFNFISFRPKKTRLNLEIKIPKTEETDQAIESAGFDTLEYNSRWQLYRLSISKDDIESSGHILRDLFKLAYQRRTA